MSIIFDSTRFPMVMGILNMTPDSFSDGGRFTTVKQGLSRIEEMIHQGAHIIDVGGESTRPGSDPVPAKEEIERVVPLLREAVAEFPETLFSCDTMKASVAAAALDAGVQIINDVSGLQNDPEKAELAARYAAALVIMHAQGKPKTMQLKPTYDNVIADISTFLKEKAEFAKQAGVKEIMVDPGIGFGKTTEHNLDIFRGIDAFTKIGYPVLVGVSRKSVIGKLLDDRPVEGRLAGTIAIHYDALLKGAAALRVHDVQEASDSIRIFNAIYRRQAD